MEETANYPSAFLMKVLVRVLLAYRDLCSSKSLSSRSTVCAVVSCTQPGGVSPLGSQLGSLGTCALKLFTMWPFALQRHLRL